MQIFILHTQEQACTGCGAIEQMSTLYQAEELPAAGRAHKLLPCTVIGPADPVRTVELPFRTTPICAECADQHTMSSDLYSRWQETLARKAQERAVFVKTVKQHSLEDLA